MKDRKQFFFLILLVLSSFNNSAFAKIEAVIGNRPLEDNPNLAVKISEAATDEIIISRDQYVISYNKVRRSPNWVAWKLESGQIGSSGRSDKFLQDEELEFYLKQSQQSARATGPLEFRGSCLDRGHQIPSADRTDTRENNQSTFLMSNMIPQTPYLNRVVWAHLEQHTRDLVLKQGKKAYIVTGPIYDEDFGKIGPNEDIPVPSKEFKVIFVLGADQDPEDINEKTENISVIMPNTQEDGSKPVLNLGKLCKPFSNRITNKNDWAKYKTTLKEIERLSGYKFLSK